MQSNLSYYGSAFFFGIICFIIINQQIIIKNNSSVFLDNDIEINTDNSFISNPDSAPEGNSYQSRHEEYVAKYNEDSLQKILTIKTNHFTSYNITNGPVHFIFLSNSEFIVLIEENNIVLVYATGEIIKRYTNDGIYYVLEAPVYSKEEGEMLSNQYDFSGSFYSLNGKKVTDWAKTKQDSSAISKLMELINERSTYKETAKPFIERWSFIKKDSSLINISTEQIFTMK